jgi:hypothetical protein
VQFRVVVMSGKYITSLENTFTSLENTSPLWNTSLHSKKYDPLAPNQLLWLEE